jgi:mono/diheme cytochrome c family protein
MRRLLRIVAWLAFLFLLVMVAGLFVVQGRGFSARPEPSWIEARLALFMRGWLTPSTYQGLQNPVSNTQENFVAAREHFADHCASCHGNDGSGNTEMGRNLYPKAPDMRLPRTQNLSDGEIFYIIENGVRLTGMPAWGTGTSEGEEASWTLVHFIRHLPSITDEEVEQMKALNPKSPEEWREEEEARKFLEGGSEPPPKASAGGHKHGG